MRGNGGGIYDAGSLTASRVTVSGNSVGASGQGGGIWTSGSSSMGLTNATISGNSLGTSGDGAGTTPAEPRS